jgi:hypothetical protein
MSRKWIPALIVLCPLVALAQPGVSSRLRSSGGGSAYQPAVPAANTNVYGGGGWGWGGGAPSTAAGSAMSGMSQVISAAGQYNLATSAAAVNLTQAQRNKIQNDQLATDTYFQMRATNKAAREAEAGPKPTMEQLVRISQQGVPKPLNTSQMDPVSGHLDWPEPLQDGRYTAERGEVDQLFAKRASYGGLTYSDRSKVRETIDSMADELKEQVRDIPPQDYVASRTFLQSLIYAATKTELE